MHRIRTATAVTALAAALAAPVVAAVPASAQAAGSQQGGGDRPRVEATGACSVAGTWDLSAKADDGGIEIEFEVDTNVAGQVFNVRVTDGTTVVFAGRQTTAGRSGSFSLERHTADQAGRDVIRAVARSGSNTCTGLVRF